VKTWKNVAKFAFGGLKWIRKGLEVYGLMGTVGEYIVIINFLPFPFGIGKSGFINIIIHGDK